MRKFSAVALVTVAALAIGSVTPLILQAQSRGTPAAPAAAGEDMPTRTAKAFAPFLRAIITRRYRQADQIFKIRPGAEFALEEPETARVLGRLIRTDRFELNLIGGRTLGQNIGILLFMIASEDGPVAFKIYYYGYGNNINISRIDVYSEWEQIEQVAGTVEILTTPVTLPLGTPPE